MRPRSAMLTTLHVPLALAAALVVTNMQPLAAQSGFEAGLDAFLHSDYAVALRHWTPLARAGHAQAAFNLGRMYELGQGVVHDDVTAAGWFRMAAERGHPGAQQNLGQILAEGRGGQSDPVEAHLWLSLAARQAPPGSPAAKLLELQLEALRRRLDASQRADADAALAAWSPRRD